jgi:hypothetical protein
LYLCNDMIITYSITLYHCPLLTLALLLKQTFTADVLEQLAPSMHAYSASIFIRHSSNRPSK